MYMYEPAVIVSNSAKIMSPHLDGQLLYMSQNGAIKAIMKIPPAPNFIFSLLIALLYK